MQEEFGYNQDPDEVTEKQQQACVAASATIGALLRYICRLDELNASRNERNAQEYGWGQIGPLTKEQQQACVSASATISAC